MSVTNKKKPPSPSPTITLDPNPNPKRELQRSSSDESIRVLHHAVLFPDSPHAGRVTYIRRRYETDADLVKRQLALIALQPLTYAEELKARRKQLEIKAEKRKQDKAVIEATKATGVPEIAVIPASGKLTPLPNHQLPTKTRPKEAEGNGRPLKPKLTKEVRQQHLLGVRSVKKKHHDDNTKDTNKQVLQTTKTS